MAHTGTPAKAALEISLGWKLPPRKDTSGSFAKMTLSLSLSLSLTFQQSKTLVMVMWKYFIGIL
jgi:hypothetical protein